MSDIQETQDILSKHKAESNVRRDVDAIFKGDSKFVLAKIVMFILQRVRKEVVELRRSLQQSQVETEFLRGELGKAGGQLVSPAHSMEEKIQLLKEV